MGFTDCPISAATCSSVSCLRPQITTRAPSREKTSAMARPMPRLAPVTIATFPFNAPTSALLDESLLSLHFKQASG
jgi:hypothetical protein